MTVILELTRIVQAAAEAENPATQVKLVVDAIHDYMAMDVCSLYLADEEGDMALVASHGLGASAVGKARLPRGAGLVGWVAANRHPLNIIDPASHPAFYYLPGSDEEQFRSFCGVPLVRGGDVIGVLTVQSGTQRQLTAEEEAFLVTLGAQLAMVVANWSDWHLTGTLATRAVKGIRSAPGIGIGATHLCRDANLFSVVDAPCKDCEASLVSWRQLVQDVQEDVRREQADLGSALSKEVTAIFDAYHMLLGDPALLSGVEQGIRAGHDLPSALKAVIHHYSELFLAMEDPYLRARSEDIHHLGNRLYGAWLGTHQSDIQPSTGGQVILVGNQVSVSDIANVSRHRLAGIASFKGSALSHTAVLANALGIPAIMGLGELKGISNGDPMIVDGNTGQLILHPNSAIEIEYRNLAAAEQRTKGRLHKLRDQPAVTTDGCRIELFANSGLLADISPGLANGAEGLGLYRTEIPFMISDTFPSEEDQVRTYSQVMQAYRGKPVYMRILDIGGDKPLPYFPIREENPALGWRGIRICLDNTALLITQVRAMLRAAIGFDNLHILLPMVTATSELVRFRAILEDALAQLQAEGSAVSRPRVGIMVEVPAAISQLPLWREYLDFASIGSNDLSQYLLAVDRNNPRVSSVYDHLHPAVLHEIARTVDKAEALGLPLSLCGEMSSDPAAVILLVGMGIRRLSMSAARLPQIKWLIRNIDTDYARQLLAEVRDLPDSSTIRDTMNRHLQDLKLP